MARIVGADHRELASAATRSRNRLAASKTSAYPFSRTKPTDEADDHVVGRDRTELGAHAPGRRRSAIVERIETIEVDAVAEQRQLARGHADARRSVVEVLGVLHQLGVRARRRDPLEPVDHGALRASRSSGSA